MNSEPTVNAFLGQALDRRHPRWKVVAEASQVLRDRAHRPDILVAHRDAAPVVVETEFPPGAGVEADALARLGRRLGSDGRRVEHVVAVLLDDDLRLHGQEGLGARVAASAFRYALYGGSRDDPTRWPGSGWLEGGIDQLAAVVEHAGVSERIVAEGTEVLERTVREAAGYAIGQCGGGGARPGSLDRIAAELCQEPGVQTVRMAMAILGNAVAFHRSIADVPGVPALSPNRPAAGLGLPLHHEVIACWTTILREINYWPIFDIALRLFGLLPPRVAITVVGRMEKMTGRLESLGVLAMQDISGQMFQRLISDRKFLATFYTLPTSSALLATLGVGRLDIDWSDPEAVTGLRIADLACGTGTLLGAAYQALRSRFRWAGGDDATIHATVMEKALIGADIMPAATHLTASTLSSAHPGVPFAGTKIMTCPYGEQPDESGRPLALGSLDLIEGETAVSVLGTRSAQAVQTDAFGTGREEIHGTGGRDPADDGAPAEDALFVNLHRRPATEGEGVVVGEAIRRLSADGRSGRIRLGDEEAASWVRAPLSQGGCAGLRDPGIADTMLALPDGRLRLPRVERPLPLPVVRLGDLGRKGRLDRDVNGRHPDGSPRGPFDIVVAGPAPEFPALWSHAAERERTIALVRESEGRVRDGMRKQAYSLWNNHTSRLHFTRDFRINSQSLAACLTGERTIGGTAWPNFIVADPAWEVPLALWANTTLGLMSFWWMGTRQQQGRARLTLSRLPELPVPDPRVLTAERAELCRAIWRDFRDEPLLPANEAYRDDARAELDRAVLAGALGMPEGILGGLAVLRDKWCHEPSVHGGKGTRPGA